MESKLSVGLAHVGKIQAAITAAEEDGFSIKLDIHSDSYYDDDITSIDIDLTFKTTYISTIREVDCL